jgi:ATP-dependent DNA helicase PIF1
MRKNVCCDELVRLKVGAQVMCLANIDLNALVYNGSQGVVTGICPRTGYPMVLFRRTTEPVRIEPFIWKSTEIPKIGISQVPLILAWAITIHKSQGATLDMAEIDVGTGIFECGQTYVALSRVKSLEGLYLQSFDARQIRVNKKAQDFYMNLDSKTILTDATINIQGTGTEIIKP